MLQTIISTISSFMYSKLLVIILIGAGMYFTVRTRFPQVRLFKRACGSVMEKPEDKKAISSFQALMVSTASRVGTGDLYRRIWFCILDVGDCDHRKCICSDREYIGTDL